MFYLFILQICYRSRGLATTPGPAAQGGETRATQGGGYDVEIDDVHKPPGFVTGCSGDLIGLAQGDFMPHILLNKSKFL